MTEQRADVPPSLKRRMAAFLYEGVLLFGVVMLAGLIYSPLTQQRHALHGQHGLQAVVFLSIAFYFVWFWTHSGQTLALKTWHLRVVDLQGRPVGWARAILRYLLSWLWFLPGLASVYLAGLSQSGAGICTGLAAGVGAYVLLARLHPRRQFLHELLSGTRVITQLPKPRHAAGPTTSAVSGDPS